jgi:pimeloyl-ACP methyl ester carboxylesterase
MAGRWFSFFLVLAACSHAAPSPPTPAPPIASSAAPTTITPAAAVELEPAPPAPAVVERFRVPGDQAASIVRNEKNEAPAIVFLPGLCSNANAYLWGFPEAARRAGGVVAIEGDQPCPGAPGFHSFTWDSSKQHARIEAALGAAGVSEIRAGGLVLIGYSQGASIAEQLAARFPERYSRIVLIGQPGDPQPADFHKSRAVVTMSCSLDVPYRMKPASKAIEAAGTPSTYVQMPGCTHGNIAAGDESFDTVFGWLDKNSRAPIGTEPIPIAGYLK